GRLPDPRGVERPARAEPRRDAWLVRRLPDRPDDARDGRNRARTAHPAPAAVGQDSLLHRLRRSVVRREAPAVGRGSLHREAVDGERAARSGVVAPLRSHTGPTRHRLSVRGGSTRPEPGTPAPAAPPESTAAPARARRAARESEPDRRAGLRANA